ncbi:hypothetical protein Tco_1484950 [Tanacetum coccineum]
MRILSVVKCSDEVMMLARCGGLNGGDEPAVMVVVVRDRVDRSGGVVYGVGGGSPEVFTEKVFRRRLAGNIERIGSVG